MIHKEWKVIAAVPEGLLLKCEESGETALVLNATVAEIREAVPRVWSGGPERVTLYDDYLKSKAAKDRDAAWYGLVRKNLRGATN